MTIVEHDGGNHDIFFVGVLSSDKLDTFRGQRRDLKKEGEFDKKVAARQSYIFFGVGGG